MANGSVSFQHHFPFQLPPSLISEIYPQESKHGEYFEEIYFQGLRHVKYISFLLLLGDGDGSLAESVAELPEKETVIIFQILKNSTKEMIHPKTMYKSTAFFFGPVLSGQDVFTKIVSTSLAPNPRPGRIFADKFILIKLMTRVLQTKYLPITE